MQLRFAVADGAVEHGGDLIMLVAFHIVEDEDERSDENDEENEDDEKKSEEKK